MNYKLAYEVALAALKQITYDGPHGSVSTATKGMMDSHNALQVGQEKVKLYVVKNNPRETCKDSF